MSAVFKSTLELTSAILYMKAAHLVSQNLLKIFSGQLNGIQGGYMANGTAEGAQSMGVNPLVEPLIVLFLPRI